MRPQQLRLEVEEQAQWVVQGLMDVGQPRARLRDICLKVLEYNDQLGPGYVSETLHNSVRRAIYEHLGNDEQGVFVRDGRGYYRLSIRVVVNAVVHPRPRPGATLLSQADTSWRVRYNVPSETKVDVHALAKRMLGNEWNARDEGRVRSWIEGRLEVLPENIRRPFVGTVLEARDAREVAREMGIAWATLRARVADAFQMLGVLARSLPKDRFQRLFKSVYEHEFSKKVRTRELTECLFGRYDRRSTQTIAVKWIPKVQTGEVNLPMPRKQGKFWIWTKEEAEAWRQWFAEGKPEKEEADVQ